MSPLAVASFPHSRPARSNSLSKKSSSPELSASPRCLASRRGRATTTILAPDAVEQTPSYAQLQADHDSSTPPCSPVIFSTPPGYGRPLDHHADMTASSASPSRRLAALGRGASQAGSTKASLGTLGLSRLRPSDLLSSCRALNPQRGLWDQHIPPRSSSLPDTHRTIECSPLPSPMPASQSSLSRVSTADDCCSEIHFAERSPDEPEYGSAARTPALSLRTHALPDPRRECSSIFARHIYIASSSSIASRPEPRTAIYHNDDSQTPYSLMGAGPGLGFRLRAQPAASRPKIKLKTKASLPASAPACQDCTLRRGYQRVKRFATRRSITALDAFAPPSSEHEGRESPATTPALSPTMSRSLESVLSGELESPDGDTSKSGRVVVAHRVVGDVWEPQDVDQVIPALRSLKLSGKGKLGL